ncbi:MAG: hypothetical protein AB7F82_05880 [Alphaproteobacteria bacterium]
MQEQRLTVRLRSYWDMVRKDQPYPDIHRFNTSAIEDIWPFCFRVSINHTRPPTFTYEYMGEELVKLYGHDLTGLTVSPKMAHFPGSMLHQRLENLLQLGGQPMQDNGHLINFDGKLIRYRACLLPLGNERNGITHIICGLSCRYFE